MLSEMRVASVLAKVVDRNTEVATAGDSFNAATLAGARALARDDLGRLAPGARADFVCYRTDTISMAPLRDPIRNLVYSALPSDVDRVVIDGRTVLESGHAPGLNERALAHGIQHAAEQLWAQIPEHHWDGLTTEQISPQTLREWETAGTPAD